jgi:hypothetical protein
MSPYRNGLAAIGRGYMQRRETMDAINNRRKPNQLPALIENLAACCSLGQEQR